MGVGGAGHLLCGLTFNAQPRYVWAMSHSLDDTDDAAPPPTGAISVPAVAVQGPHPETVRKKVRSAAAIARREKVKAILETIGAGTPPAVAIRKGGMTPRDFYRVLRKSPSLDRAYELSRQAGAQVIADQGLALAAHISRQKGLSPSQVMSMKLRLDYTRWYVGTLYPKAFSDRLAAMDAPAKGGGNVTVVVVMDDRKPAADDRLIEG